jgi:mannose-6-phosphate isomerase class I
MNPIMFQTTDWNSIPVKESHGESGTAQQRILQFEGLRVRIVEYSANYKADHWCKAGHIVYCLEGEMISELEDGRTFKLTKGMSYIVSDDASCHKSYSATGVKLMIIDGRFLNHKNGLEKNPWRM